MRIFTALLGVFALVCLTSSIQVRADEYVYQPSDDPADYIFSFCPTRSSEGAGVYFAVADKKHFQKTGELIVTQAIRDLLRSLSFNEQEPNIFQYESGEPDATNDRELGTQVLLDAGFKQRDGFCH